MTFIIGVLFNFCAINHFYTYDKCALKTKRIFMVFSIIPFLVFFMFSIYYTICGGWGILKAIVETWKE